MKRSIRFRSTPTAYSITDPQAQVDADAGIVKGVSAIQTVEALGHRMMVDGTTVQQTVDQINAATGGLKSRFTHPGMCDDGTGKMLGRVTNARLSEDGSKAICDLHIASYAAVSPDGDLRSYVLARAQEDPASFGLSIAATMHGVWRLRDGTEIMSETDEGEATARPDSATTDLPLCRLDRLQAVDVVGDPAANRDGLFSAGSENAAEAFAYLDRYAEDAGLSSAKLAAFACRYLATRGVTLSVVTASGNSAPATPVKGNAMKPEELKSLCAKHPDHAGLIVAHFADGKGVAEIEAIIKDAEGAKVAAHLAAATLKITELSAAVDKMGAEHKAAVAAKDAEIKSLSEAIAKGKKLTELAAGTPAPVGGLETDDLSGEPSDIASAEKRWSTDAALRAEFFGEKDTFMAGVKLDLEAKKFGVMQKPATAGKDK